jgi:hypothetical protein
MEKILELIKRGEITLNDIDEYLDSIGSSIVKTTWLETLEENWNNQEA